MDYHGSRPSGSTGAIVYMRLRVGDLFCGTGGFSYGFSQTGQFEVVLGIDIRPSSVETFKANHGNALAVCEDIRNIKISNIAAQLGQGAESIDVLIGGPPCQGFSSIRPFRSINENDQRNSLFEQFVLYISFFRPQFVVLENVVGLLHHQRGSTLNQIKAAVEALDYTAEYRVLNAVAYGIPQKRERVILLGRRGTGTKPIFPEATHENNGRSMAGNGTHTPLPLFSKTLRPAVTLRQAISDLPKVGSSGSAGEYNEDLGSGEYAAARRRGCQHLTLHSSTRHTPRMLEIIKRAGTNRWALPEGMTTSGFSSCYSRLSYDEPSTTITVNFVHPASNRCIHPVQDRALTPREGARIQSFDDDFAFRGSRTEVVKQIGEAVPPLLGTAIAKALIAQW
jgi:DNA (cytosine-5)-methyltransferase 1